ncbi:uncharacterized protein BXZ73DRAFT_108644 [Epithele typhae]|uniref:uncharacterized protein n=1 Tax=Epithele typhae TaxID=378194 RepID=UPI0020087D66|nr:uncharacterized protein BXZ73DRAFT_108644 [Epithele typhae]KAH9910692.1 hypothetical protein BXZ73DRAFT_108644 [Epithele typhae]
MSSMIKGILSLESAEIAINEGIDGIIVSNHIFHEAHADAGRFEVTATASRSSKHALVHHWSFTRIQHSRSPARELRNHSRSTSQTKPPGPYMEMLLFWLCGPLGQHPDGTAVFAAPMVALQDLGFFACYAFDHRSGRDLEVASAGFGWAELAATYARVTGCRAEYLPLSVDEWIGV